jgi:hypothetical protein
MIEPEKTYHIIGQILTLMLSQSQLSESQIYIESERWQCSFGWGKPVKLGMVLEAVDLSSEGRDFSYIIEASLIPQLEFLDEEILEVARAEGLNGEEEMLRYAYECYGGVPVNIDALQPAKASCGMSSFVAESSIDTVVTGTGEATESRHFQDLSEAITFARDFYAVYAPIIFGFIDVILDHPLRVGGTGWDKIKQMAKK